MDGILKRDLDRIWVASWRDIWTGYGWHLDERFVQDMDGIFKRDLDRIWMAFDERFGQDMDGILKRDLDRIWVAAWREIWTGYGW